MPQVNQLTTITAKGKICKRVRLLRGKGFPASRTILLCYHHTTLKKKFNEPRP